MYGWNGILRERAGFTLLESMIATLILGTGLLALAGMQTISFSRNVDANELTRVTNLAAEMVERIQFNRRNALAYNGIDTLNVATQPPSTQPMARGDYAQWRALLSESGLSSVQGNVTVSPTGPTNPPLNQTLVTITVNWFGSSRGETSTRRNRTLTFRTVMAPE
ncbi:MAG: hypothetical protein A3H49_09455 [Nitrospirae bacterium RIFCSPLOWO2_02_FULL_62_14]|nr:MAG: hypothetical protein A3H49_09455 [Nitrospirae bacterium RIFCSPLOWO2_02_FULL_62_14]